MLTGHLVEQLGWRTTFFAVAACALALVPLMLRLLPRSMPVAADADTSSLAASLPPRGAMRLPAFWLLTAVLTISQVCMNGVLFNIVAYLTANGLDRSDAIALYSLTNFMSLPGLVIGGLISDRVAARTLLPLILALQAAGTLALLGIGAPFPFGLAATAAFVIVWGGIAGLPAQAGSLALKDVAGSRDFTNLLAVMFTLNGLVGALAPALLAQHGCTMDDVVDLTSFHVGYPANMPAFMSAMGAAMPGPQPAWTAIGVAAAGYPDTLVELKAVARIPDATTMP